MVALVSHVTGMMSCHYFCCCFLVVVVEGWELVSPDLADRETSSCCRCFCLLLFSSVLVVEGWGVIVVEYSLTE